MEFGCSAERLCAGVLYPRTERVEIGGTCFYMCKEKPKKRPKVSHAGFGNHRLFDGGAQTLLGAGVPGKMYIFFHTTNPMLGFHPQRFVFNASGM